MGSIEGNHNGNCIEDTSAEQLFSPHSSDTYDVFGDPELLPRVGDQYQVEIPPVITESECLLYKKNPFEVEFAAGVPCDFITGLPIPIIWINKEVENSKHEGLEFIGDSNGTINKKRLFKSESNKKVQKCSDNEDSKLKVEPVDYEWENGIGSGELANLALEHEMKSKMHQKYRGEEYCLVPCSFGGSWSDIEEASFLLGLYIFGKNLVQVKKFMESKLMGDILAFYYGKFYRSDEYRRWSDCRKMRSRRCVYGQRIFTGLRQQELLSRLFLRVSEECQKTLLEVSKTFGEGKMLLEEYVSTLKAIVGMKSLVEAVGIGKGKRDLTGITMEPLKSNHVIPMRSEIPIGKACSSLTPKEIIKFLTGDFRLSKARSNDLFWEAVWPRLLARGWHSEQPKDQVYAAGSKNSLVFLMPGVKKFSRRRLVKGKHYFDSVTDVLNKVASDPSLLELETEEDENNRNKEEYGWTTETKLEQDDLSDRRRHCYLQPRTPNRGANLMMKFTVVDTSLADGKTFKLRELRTLPEEVSKKTISRSPSEESEEDSSEVSSEDSDYVDTMIFDQEDTNISNSIKTVPVIGIFSDEKDLEIGASHQGINCPDSGNASIKNSKDLNNFCEDKQPKKSQKCCRGLRQYDLNYLAPVTKRRRRLSACARAETRHRVISFSVSPSLEREKHICFSETTDSSENNIFGIGSSQKRVSATSSSKGSPIESSEGISCDTNFGADGPYDKLQPRTLIDLNLPQVSPDFETGEFSMIGLRDRQNDQTSKPEKSTAPKPSADVTFSKQQPNMNSPRQSTRIRPPTAKALEALANGFLTTSRKRKNKEACPRENSTSRPPRRTRGGMEVTENFGTGTVASQVVKVGNRVCDVEGDLFSKFEILSEGNAAQVMGP